MRSDAEPQSAESLEQCSVLPEDATVAEAAWNDVLVEVGSTYSESKNQRCYGSGQFLH